jgi:hypothetical protein
MRESLNLEIVDALSIRLGVPSSLPMAEKGGATFEHVIGKERPGKELPADHASKQASARPPGDTVERPGQAFTLVHFHARTMKKRTRGATSGSAGRKSLETLIGDR